MEYHFSRRVCGDCRVDSHEADEFYIMNVSTCRPAMIGDIVDAVLAKLLASPLAMLV